MGVTFSRIKLRPSARVHVAREVWYGNRLRDDARLLALVSEPPAGVGLQELVAEGESGTLYVFLYDDPAALTLAATRLLAREATASDVTTRTVSGPGCVVVCESSQVERFFRAVSVRLSNRLREARYGGPPLEEDPLDEGPLPVLFRTLGDLS